ncbi:MAG: Copper binding protein plastocyanin/azurin family [Acidobacteriales bacterium]|nr:Copper binding protein plastocyanin/azurin family [Terriglobales bacterium]
MSIRPAISLLLLGSVMTWMLACSSGTPTPATQNTPAAASTTEKPATAPDAQQATTHTISITGFKFQPSELTVKVGDTVEWKNMDSMPHNAVAKDKSFDSGKLKTGMTGKFVADEKAKGTHDYICTYHPNMKARLTVE